MANRAENEGVRVLDDFVCDAINTPDIPQDGPGKPGPIDGIQAIQEHDTRDDTGTKDEGKPGKK